MDKYYKEFLDNIKLTSNQVKDGRAKYQGVCDCLAKYFYGRDLCESDKILFGSFKTKTQVRPMEGGQDVDVVFKIDESVYEKYQDNPSGMLQKIRSILKEKYATTDHISAWGKVVLVEFSEGCHNVEVAPCFEREDGVFLIPNTCFSESDWEEFDVRGQLDSFATSNEDSDGLARDLVKMIKKWAHNTSSLSYSSYNIVNDVIRFITQCYPSGRGTTSYNVVIKDWFTYMENNTPIHLQNYKSSITTAKDRAVKAMQFANDGKYIEATKECIKIFGNMFPKAGKNQIKENECSTITPVRPWASC